MAETSLKGLERHQRKMDEILTRFEHPALSESRAAVKQLANYAHPEAVPLLIQVFKKVHHRDLVAASLTALGKTRSPEAVDTLIEGLSHDRWEVRQSAAEALDRNSNAKAIPGLLKALEDEVYPVMGGAVSALLTIGRSRKVAGEKEYAREVAALRTIAPHFPKKGEPVVLAAKLKSLYQRALEGRLPKGSAKEIIEGELASE